MAGDALEHVVPAGHVAADEARGVGIRNRVVLLEEAFLLRVVNEGVEVVTDDLGHAGGGHGDHVGLVGRLAVLQTVLHVLLAAEHRRVFGHRVGYAGHRLTEVTVEVGAEIGHAALRAVHVGHGLFEAQRAEHRAQRLAGLGRVDGQRFARKVQFLVFLGGGPLEDFVDLVLRMLLLEVIALAGKHVLVFFVAEQRIAGFDVIDLLAHDSSPAPHSSVNGASGYRPRACPDRRGRPQRTLRTVAYNQAPTATFSTAASVFCQGACSLLQHGLFRVMSMSRAKMAKPSKPWYGPE
ncbi:hypothetical protein D9M71_304200 [compost metagenome]